MIKERKPAYLGLKLLMLCDEKSHLKTAILFSLHSKPSFSSSEMSEKLRTIGFDDVIERFRDHQPPQRALRRIPVKDLIQVRTCSSRKQCDKAQQWATASPSRGYEQRHGAWLIGERM